MKKIFSAIGDFMRKADMLLLFLSVLCTAFGMVLIASATHAVGSRQYLLVQGTALAIGLVLFILFSIIDVDIISEKWKPLFLGSVLLILSLAFIGAEESGNKSWIRFGPVGIQPTELVKIAFIILMAKHIAYLKAYKDLNSFFSVTQLAVHLFFIMGIIVLASRDLGSALVYLFIFVAMVFAGGLKFRWFAIAAVLLAILLPILWFLVLKDYQKVRIIAPYNPAVDPTGLEVLWQTNRSKLAIASGQLFGQGLWKGVMTQSRSIPELQTDFIFAVAGEELGLLGCLAVIFLLGAVIFRCVYIGMKSKDSIGLLVCLGVAGMLIFQTLENIGMCLGLTPVIGLTLPFFSYGGSSIMTMFAAMGLVSGIKFRPQPSSLRR